VCTKRAGQQMKPTKANVAALVLPPGKTDHTEWFDGMPGRGVRVRKTKHGVRKHYRIQLRVGTQQRSKQFDVGKVDLDDFLKIARKTFAQAHLGVDPAAEKIKARAAAASAKLTLASVSDRYLAVKRQALTSGTYSAGSLVAAERYFKIHWAPLRDRVLDNIARKDIAARVQELITDHGRSAAARARNHLSAFYRWAMAEGLVDANPTIGTNDPEAGVLPRERVLSDNELKTLWVALEDDDYGRIVKLLTLTGCRRAEIGNLRWDEIDLENGVLTILGSRTKNRRTLSLVLPKPALDILHSIRRHDGPCIFGDPGHGFTSWGVFTLKLHRRLAAAGTTLPHWTLHDLRRTMRTGLGRLGVPPHIAEPAINHVKAGIIAVYDKHRYEGEVASALAQWAEHVTAVVEGRKSKVVPLRA
jgi:integrase